MRETRFDKHFIYLMYSCLFNGTSKYSRDMNNVKLKPFYTVTDLFYSKLSLATGKDLVLYENTVGKDHIHIMSYIYIVSEALN